MTPDVSGESLLFDFDQHNSCEFVVTITLNGLDQPRSTKVLIFTSLREFLKL